MGKWGNSFDILRDVVYGRSEYLDLYEQTTLHFIYRRTQFYGKEWENIPLRHFLEGIWSKSYGCISPRIRISEKKLLESLKSLEAKGIIQVQRSVTKSNRYRILKADEAQFKKIIMAWQDGPLHLIESYVRQLERNIDILGAEHLALLTAIRDAYPRLQTASQRKYSPTDAAMSTPSIELRDTPPVREHKIPIIVKKPMKVIPRRGSPLPASVRPRLPILPAPQKKRV